MEEMAMEEGMSGGGVRGIVGWKIRSPRARVKEEFDLIEAGQMSLVVVVRLFVGEGRDSTTRRAPWKSRRTFCSERWRTCAARCAK